MGVSERPLACSRNCVAPFSSDGRDDPAVALGEEPDRAVCRPARRHGLFGAKLPLSIPRSAEGGVAENVPEYAPCGSGNPVQRCLLGLVECPAAQVFEPESRWSSDVAHTEIWSRVGHPGAHKPGMKERKVMFAHALDVYHANRQEGD